MTFSMNFLLYRIFQCGNRKEEKGERVRSLPESLRGVHALNFWRGGFFAFANSAWGRLTNARMSEHKERKTLEERHQMSDLELDAGRPRNSWGVAPSPARDAGP